MRAALKRFAPWVAVFVVGIAVGWLAWGRSADYPETIHVTMPAREPGKFAERYELLVTSTNESGDAVNLGGDGPKNEPGAPVWKLVLTYPNGKSVPLFCEPSR